MASGSSTGRPHLSPPLPPRQPEGGRPYEAGLYGIPCIGCGRELCVNMRALLTVKRMALKKYSPQVHNENDHFPFNAKRRNGFYRLYRDHAKIIF